MTMMGGEWTNVGWWGMGTAMVAWILLLAVIIGLVVWIMNRVQTSTNDRRGESGEEVLRRRFANGDIDAEEYERRLAVLRR